MDYWTSLAVGSRLGYRQIRPKTHRSYHRLRLDGYRTVEGFKHALDFVVDKAYQHTTLARYIEDSVQETVYALRDHPNFIVADDLSKLPDQSV